ncbi:MAG: Lrp/AsnC ligand binding domain-containing protein [Pseudonocardiaceae bacterium]
MRGKVSWLPGVEYVAVTSGGFDFVLLVQVPDIAALRDVVLTSSRGCLRSGPPTRSSSWTRTAIPWVGAPPRACQTRGTPSSPSTPGMITV